VLSDTTYQPGCEYTLSICTTLAPFEGVLLRGRTPSSQRTGLFRLPAGLTDSLRYLDCPGADPQATVTHSSATAKASVHLGWTAPSGNATTMPTVTFLATIVQGPKSNW